MSNNLFISFTCSDEKEEETLKKAVATLGNSTNIHDNFWYINSPHKALDALKLLGRNLSENTTMVIADTNSDTAVWHNLDEKLSTRITQNWKMKI